MVLPFRINASPQLSTAVAGVRIGHLAPHLTRPSLRPRRGVPAVLIPGDSVLETTAIGGTSTFFSIYQNVIVARILLSWFPGLQGNALVRPIITICDPYLNLFRNAVPPIFGLDLSPVLALFLLQALGSATTALGAGDAESLGPGLSPRRRRRLPWMRK